MIDFLFIKKNHNLTSCLALLLAVVIMHNGCSQNKSRDSDNASSAHLDVAAGKKLAQIHCGSCHLSVSPDMLDRETWVNGVLPEMAPKMGIRVWRENQYYPAGGADTKTNVSFAKWTQIENYFKQEAPESLPAAARPVPLQENETLFSIVKPKLENSTAPTAATTMVKIESHSGAVYTSGAATNALTRWDARLKPSTILNMESPAVDLNFDDDFAATGQAVLTTIGTMEAADILQGTVQQIKLSSSNSTSIGTADADTLAMIGSKLNRPLQARSADFNKDGRGDWIICEFGHDAGGLYLYEQQADQTYESNPVWQVPGAEDMAIGDFNDDGWPDVMVLFGYSDEGIWLFINDKKGGFIKENILRFPPVYGSTSFELADMNGDGLQDIIYTNGDNADFSPILKPYHGMRIFLNEGDHNFEESYFYPINGATKAVVEDFDEDGDMDIATIAFFADYDTQPEESFIYFENQQYPEFKPTVLPIEKLGRWIAMDAGDVDHDGDIDIVVGNFSVAFLTEAGLDPSWDTKMPFILLKNKLR